MPDWLQDTFHSDPGIPVAHLAARLVVALLLGCVVAGIYRLTHSSGRGQAAGLTATLVLLTVLIGMVTLVIGNSVARAFSLVGALAIVRFRTVVEDTRDTAFVIFAVAVGMAVGAGFVTVPLLGIPVVALAAFLYRDRRSAPGVEGILKVRVGIGQNPESLLAEPFAKHLKEANLTASGTARQGAALDLTYAVRLRERDSALPLVAELIALEGVQEAELRQS